MVGELDILDIVETTVDVVTFFDKQTVKAGARGTVVGVWGDGDAAIVEFNTTSSRGGDIVTIPAKDLVVLSKCPVPGEA